MRQISRFVCIVAAFVGIAAVSAVTLRGEDAFRTDANQNEELPWYQVQPGQFPPEGTAHYFTGELIGIDPINRTGTLRVSRTDAQRRSHWDLPIDFRMLPYGSVAYHGAPAELRDVPLGTHLHGWFYVKDPDEEIKSVFHNRKSIESDFTQAFRLEDDFSYYQGKNELWRVEAIDHEANKLTLLRVNAETDQPVGDPIEVDLTAATRVYQGRQIVTSEGIEPGQNVLFNLTWATLYGTGRCTDLWLDEESREVARQQQLARHQVYQKDHGLAGWIDEVDNPKRILTVTLFGGVDPKLLDELKPNTHVTAVVAEPTLRSYDQVNDRKAGPLLSVKEVDKRPGSSGVQVTLQPNLLLEGFRPGRIVRIFPGGWSVVALPQEEALWPERD